MEAGGNPATVRFTPTELTKIDSSQGKFVFANAEGVQLVLTKAKEQNFSYYDAF